MAKKRRPAAKKTNEEQGPLEPPLPDRRAMEKIMRQVAAELGGEKGPETPLDRAQEIMYEAFEASGSQQVRLARKALEISPNCVDAYVLLAEHAKTADEAQKLYEQGLAAGERALGRQAFEEYAGQQAACAGNEGQQTRSGLFVGAQTTAAGVAAVHHHGRGG